MPLPPPPAGSAPRCAARGRRPHPAAAGRRTGGLRSGGRARARRGRRRQPASSGDARAICVPPTHTLCAPSLSRGRTVAGGQDERRVAAVVGLIERRALQGREIERQGGDGGGRSAAASPPAAVIPPLPPPSSPPSPRAVPTRPSTSPLSSTIAIAPPHAQSRLPPAAAGVAPPPPPIAPSPSHLLHMLLHPVQVAVAAVAPDVGLFGDEDAGDEVERHGAGGGGKTLAPGLLARMSGGDSAGRPPSLASLGWLCPRLRWACWGRERGERRLCHQKEVAGGR